MVALSRPTWGEAPKKPHELRVRTIAVGGLGSASASSPASQALPGCDFVSFASVGGHEPLETGPLASVLCWRQSYQLRRASSVLESLMKLEYRHRPSPHPHRFQAGAVLVACAPQVWDSCGDSGGNISSDCDDQQHVRLADTFRARHKTQPHGDARGSGSRQRACVVWDPCENDGGAKVTVETEKSDRHWEPK